MKKRKMNNKGFTLVELIVVLVILAILAAILVPTLMGYIDKAREEKDFSTAQAVRVAAQSVIAEKYGKGGADVTALDDADKAAALKLVGADSSGNIDGKAVSIYSVSIASNQVSSICVLIDGSYYSYSSTTNTWSASKTAPSSSTGTGTSTGTGAPPGR